MGGLIFKNLSFKEAIIGYYLFQKKLLKYFIEKSAKKDGIDSQNAYIINPEWIEHCRRIINYEKIKEYQHSIHSIGKKSGIK